MLRSLPALPLLCLSLTAAAAPAAIDGQLAKRIDADVRTVLQRTGTPGATVLIAEHGRVVYRHTYGLRDREHLLPAGKQLLRNRLDYHKGYGQPTAFVFKGRHTDAGKTFNDYVIRFGPGSLLKFGVVLDKTGKIASISLG